MNYTHHLYTLILFCLWQPAAVSLSAQEGGGRISGTLLDESRAEVMYASVALLQDDSLIVNSAISSPTGEFRIERVHAGTYRLRIEHLEYEPYTTDPFSVHENGNKTLPAITLRTAVNELSEVVVTYRTPLIVVKSDRLVFNVAGTPSVAGTSGLDLLRKSPGVSIDLDNNISLLGKSGVQVYINDVPCRLSGDDLVGLLESISSDNVEAVEIITNPSARYEAEGNAGIINLVLKKSRLLGYNGSLTSSFNQGRYLRYNNGGSFNYGGDKFRINLDATQSARNAFDRFLDTKVQNNTVLGLNSNEITRRDALNVAAAADAQLSAGHLLSFNLRSVLNQADNTLDSQTDIFANGNAQLSNILLSRSLVEQNSRNYTANLNHSWQLNEHSSLISAISLGDYASDRYTVQPNTLLAADAMSVAEVDDTEFSALTGIELWSAKTDYEREWEKLVLSVGGKYSRIRTANDFAFFNTLGEEAVLDITKSNDFNYAEDVAALYAILNTKLSSTLTLNGGLRVERTRSRGQLISDLPLENKDVRRTYTDFFPNVSLSFDNQQDHTWNIGIGRRIARPNYQQLNPFESPISQLTVWKGNPFLNPQYIMNYQLSYSYKQRLVVTNTYSVTTDFFASIFEATGPGSNQIIPRNMQHATHYGLAVSYPLEVSKSWSVNALVEATHDAFAGDLEGTLIDLTNTNYKLRLQNNLQLPAGITLDISYFVEDGWVWRGSVRVRGNHNFGFGLRKYFFEKQLQLRITGADIFRTTNDYFYRGDYGGIQIDGVRSFDSQRFGLGLTWKFGNQKAKLKSNTKSALDDELNRIDS